MPKTTDFSHIHPSILKYTQNSSIAEEYDTYFKANPLFQYDCQFLHDNLTPPGTVLDLGCGTDRHLLFLESLGFTTFGIDLSDHFLKIARHKLQSFSYPHERLIKADIMHLPFNQQVKFNAVIIMFSVLGLIQGSSNRAKILASLHANLHPESKVIVHVHNYEFRYSRLVRQFKRLKSRLSSAKLRESGDKIVHNYRNIQDIYIHSFKLSELVSLFQNNGYVIDVIEGLNTRRDGPCLSDIRCNANGFLLAASPKK